MDDSARHGDEGGPFADERLSVLVGQDQSVAHGVRPRAQLPEHRRSDRTPLPEQPS